MKKAILLLFFCLSLITGRAQTITPAQKAKIDALAAAFMRQQQVPGMAISIATRDKLLFSKGYGLADVEQNVPVVAGKTKFRIASISKTLTADALMQLVESGKLDLDAPVQHYVPSFPEKRWPLTTRQVAGHLGGIRHYRDNEFLSAKHYDNVRQGLAIFKDDSLLFEPGSQYAYSSYGYNLISAVIEGAAGMDYLTYMKLNVFDKLQMTNTVPEYPDEIIPFRGRYYQLAGDRIVHAPFVDNSYKWAGGGFLSTSEDLVKFARAHLAPGYLSGASLATLTTSQKTSDGTETHYGLGWRTNTDKQGYHWLGHTGGAVGGTSKFMLFPETGIIIVVLTNLSAARLGDFPHQLFWLLME